MQILKFIKQYELGNIWITLNVYNKLLNRFKTTLLFNYAIPLIEKNRSSYGLIICIIYLFTLGSQNKLTLCEYYFGKN